MIDVDVLARIHVRKDSEAIYEALIEMANARKVRTVRQTFDELKRFNPQYEILKAHRDAFQLTTEEQFCEKVAGYIEMRWSRLSEQNFRFDKWSLCRG